MTVCLVHGWASDSRIWDGVMAAPPHNVRFIAVDLPGHGGTPLREGVDSYISDARRAFVRWHREVGDGNAPIVSWAWGGQLVVDALANQEIEPAALMLISLPPPQPLPDPYTGPLWRDWPRYCRSIARLMTAQPISLEREEWLAGMMTETSPVAAAAMNRREWQPPGKDFRLPANTLAVLGAADPIGDMRHTAKLVETWGSDVAWFAACGHIPFLERSDEFAETLRSWLATLEQD